MGQPMSRKAAVAPLSEHGEQSLASAEGRHDRIDDALGDTSERGPVQTEQLASGTLLVVGTQYSGKSTVVAQLAYRLLRRLDSEASRKRYSVLIKQQIVNDMCDLVRKATQIEDFSWTEAQAPIVKRCVGGMLTIDDLSPVATLWHDARLQECYFRLAAKGHMHEDSVDSFFDKIGIISRPQWVPTFNDVLRHRSQTQETRHCQMPFAHEFSRHLWHKIDVVDVSGAREQRRSWMHYFDETELVMFVAALSDYSCTVAGSDANALAEAMLMFRTLARCKWFTQKTLVLVFTKDDIFRRKIQVDSIGNYFPSAPQGIEGCQYTTALEFIKQQFYEQDLEVPEQRTIHTCVVDAISRLESAQTILDRCKVALSETAARQAKERARQILAP